MLALCLMFLVTYYALNYTGIIGRCLSLLYSTIVLYDTVWFGVFSLIMNDEKWPPACMELWILWMRNKYVIKFSWPIYLLYILLQLPVGNTIGENGIVIPYQCPEVANTSKSFWHCSTISNATKRFWTRFFKRNNTVRGESWWITQIFTRVMTKDSTKKIALSKASSWTRMGIGWLIICWI